MDIQLSDLLKSIRDRFWLILLATGLCVAVAGLISFYVLTPKYRANTTLLVLPEGIAFNELETNEELVPTYAEIIKSKRTAANVIDHLKLNVSDEELLKKVKISGIKNSMVTEISVTYHDPQMAVAIANSFAKNFKETLPEFMSVGEIKTIDRAELTRKGRPVSPNHFFIMAVVLLLAFNTTTGLVVLLEVLDKSVKCEKSLSKLLNVPVLAVIPRHPRKKKTNMRAPNRHHKQEKFMAESFKKLRTNLLYLQKEMGIKILLITSSVAGEGKTVTAVNLAVALAQAGKQVLLIDGNLRKPCLHVVFEVPNEHGLTTSVDDPLAREEVSTPQENLRILTSGPVPPNPSEFLTAQAMKNLLERLKQYYDIILIDSPPVIPVTDAQILSEYSDGVLLVAKIGETLYQNILQAGESLANVEARVVGAIANYKNVKQKEYFTETTSASSITTPVFI